MTRSIPTGVLSACLILMSAVSLGGTQNAPINSENSTVFRDDFTGTSLRPEWKLLREDAERWTFYEKEYLLIIITHRGSGIKNELVYTGKLPENYEITLKVQTPPVYNDQYLAIPLIRDDKNLIWFGVDANGDMHFDKHLRGEKSEIYRNIGKLTAEKSIYLRLRKDGFQYTASYSLDGTAWSKAGTHLFFNLNGRPHVQVYDAYRSPEVGVYLDYYEIKRLD